MVLLHILNSSTELDRVGFHLQTAQVTKSQGVNLAAKFSMVNSVHTIEACSVERNSGPEIVVHKLYLECLHNSFLPKEN
jgi:hypothetical protein